MNYQVVVSSSFWALNGVNIFSQNLIRGLIKQGLKSHLLLTEQNTNLVKVTDPWMQLPEDIPIHHLPVKADDLWGGHWGSLVKYLEERAPCVYIPNADFRHSVICPLLPKDVSVVGIVHSDDPLHYDHVRRLGKYWDAIVTVSKTVAQKTVAANPETKNRVVTIPIGVPAASSYPKRSQGNGFPLRIFYHGLLIQRQKRILDLPRIMRGLRESGVEAVLTIAGGGHQQEELLNECQDLIEEGIVRFIKVIPHDEILRLLEEQEVFVLTSEFEGMPNALLEAMGRGCVPVVTCVSSGIPELLKDGLNGFLLPIGEVEAFVNRLTLLHRNRELWKTLSHAAYQTICQGPFNVDHMTEQYVNLFSQVLTKAKRGVYRRPTGRLESPPSQVDGISIFPVDCNYNKEDLGMFPTHEDYEAYKTHRGAPRSTKVHRLIRTVSKFFRSIIRSEKKKIKNSTHQILLRFWQPTNVMHFSHKVSVKLRLFRKRIKRLVHSKEPARK